MLAPVALFVYRRPEHTRRVLASLSANPELAQSPLWIFCEGPKGSHDAEAVAQVRALVRSRVWSDHTQVVDRPANLGCAASILDGINQVLAQHERIIVLEDDLEVSPGFLGYMNAALERYADEPRVMQVAGYMFPVALPGSEDAVFLPVVNSWGWGTWRRAWQHLELGPAQAQWLQARPWRRRRFDLAGAYPYTAMLGQADRQEIDAWDIYWYATVFRRRGLVLYPVRSMVTNGGFEGGTHAGDLRLLTHVDAGFRVLAYPAKLVVRRDVLRAVRGFLLQGRSRPGWRAMTAWPWRLARRLVCGMR